MQFLEIIRKITNQKLIHQTKAMEEVIKKYLDSKGISYAEKNGELITKCIFSSCDSDSRGSEAHLYISKETGQYQCKKCLAEGNLITLKKYYGDTDEVKAKTVKKISATEVEKYHKGLTLEIIEYLNNRGISNDVIKKMKIGYGYIHGTYWIMIPIADIDGNYLYFKLRQDPKFGSNKLTWTSGSAQIFSWSSVITANDKVMVVEGEMDALLMQSLGINAVSSTHGAGTFKDEWVQHFNPDLEHYICYDNDEAGKSGALRAASILYKHGIKKLKIITLPEEVGEKGDLGDYVVRLKMPLGDLFSKYAKDYPEKIDVSQFKPMNAVDIQDCLNSVIKKDEVNKTITFLAMVLTYTKESQINLFFNAPSSTGKSHIPLSTVEYYPKEDILTLAGASPTAFFHEQGVYNKEKNEMRIDLAKKILIFVDMPHPMLLEKLRSFLSHDEKESKSKITDKSQQGGNKTKTVILLGFPTVIFCSAGLKVDEQESTRMIMLSPSVEQDKLTLGIQQSIKKEVDRAAFSQNIESDPKRKQLRDRILAIKQAEIDDVIIENPDLIERSFLIKDKPVKPRQQRDVKKVIALVKAFALLNMWFRKQEGKFIFATDEDIRAGFELWDSIAEGQDYGLAPYIFNIYKQIILPLWEDQENEVNLEHNEFKGDGISRKKILKKHNEFYGRPLSSIYLRQHILPQLEQSGLIMQKQGTTDGRQMMVIPLETEIEK